jgi:hypothetical protein
MPSRRWTIPSVAVIGVIALAGCEPQSETADAAEPFRFDEARWTPPTRPISLPTHRRVHPARLYPLRFAEAFAIRRRASGAPAAPE